MVEPLVVALIVPVVVLVVVVLIVVLVVASVVVALVFSFYIIVIARRIEKSHVEGLCLSLFECFLEFHWFRLTLTVTFHRHPHCLDFVLFQTELHQLEVILAGDGLANEDADVQDLGSEGLPLSVNSEHKASHEGGQSIFAELHETRSDFLDEDSKELYRKLCNGYVLVAGLL